VKAEDRVARDGLASDFQRQFADSFIELKRALREVEARCAEWPDPAEQQMHADIGRSLSRILKGVEPGGEREPARDS
jgi:hypothetical protein